MYLIDDPQIVTPLNNPPTVSICIPTLNDAETLGRSLESIQSQDYDDFEIVVIDGYSDDGTVEIAEQHADEVIFDDGNYGSACQRGVDRTDGSVVGIFDGDIYFPHESWLSNAVKQFECSDRVSTVWPRNEAPPDSGRLTQLYFEHWDLIIEDRIRAGRGYYGGGNSLFRRSALEEIGGVSDDIHWGADFDWARRLEEAGYQVVYHRDPIYHDTMRSFEQFYAKQFSGASTFSDKGFGMMGMSLPDVVREQFLLGTIGMVRGLAFEEKPYWALYPVYILLRSLAYGYEFGKVRLGL